MTKNLIKLNTARNCLRYIIRAYGIEEIYVPYYICPTIKSAIRKEKAKINFYHVDKKFMPVNDFGKDYFILYPNYFVGTNFSLKYAIVLGKCCCKY